MPPYASSLPGFWLLVPGAMSLIGLTELAGDTSATGTADFLAAVGSIMAVALGVLCGTQLLAWLEVGARRVGRRSAGSSARRSAASCPPDSAAAG